MIKIAKGGNTHNEETKPGIEKFAYVLDGKVEANIGEERYVLGRGDTLYFESSIPHAYRAMGRRNAKALTVVYPAR